MSISKKVYLQSLGIAKSASDSYNENDEGGQMTYLTAFGMVSGMVMSIDDLDFSSVEKLKEDLTKYMGDEKGVDLFSIANAVYGKSIKKEDETANTSAIYLQDVKIINSDLKVVVNSKRLVLFEDQIIGVIPSKIGS